MFKTLEKIASLRSSAKTLELRANQLQSRVVSRVTERVSPHEVDLVTGFVLNKRGPNGRVDLSTQLNDLFGRLNSERRLSPTALRVVVSHLNHSEADEYSRSSAAYVLGADAKNGNAKALAPLVAYAKKVYRRPENARHLEVAVARVLLDAEHSQRHKLAPMLALGVHAIYGSDLEDGPSFNRQLERNDFLKLPSSALAELARARDNYQKGSYQFKALVQAEDMLRLHLKSEDMIPLKS